MVLVFNFNNLQADSSLGKHKKLFKVDEIKVLGSKKVEAEAILEKISTKPGMTLDNYTLRSDLKKIYDLKYFDSVEFHKEVKAGKTQLIIAS
jgi:outer membrane protein insertion porin family